VSAGVYSVSDQLHGQLFGDEQQVQDDGVASRVCGVNQPKFGRVGNLLSVMKARRSSISLILVSAATRAAS
jgi:hypothetical protein